MRRRTLLEHAGIATTGIAALGATTASGATYVPVVSTRGHYDDSGNLESGYDYNDYETDGTVPGIDTGCVDDLTVFVHGWDKKDDGNAVENAEAKFEEADTELDGDGYGGTVIGYSWDNNKGGGGDYGWNESQQIAEYNGTALAQFVLDYKYYCGGTVRIVAHSLGAAVAYSALETLDASSYWDDQYWTVQSVHTIGAAVDNERPTTEHGDGYYAVANETDATFNYYSEEDDVLEYAYNSFEWDQALGETGKESGNTAPSNYTDRNVTSQVGNDHSSYLQHCSDDIVADM